MIFSIKTRIRLTDGNISNDALFLGRGEFDAFPCTLLRELGDDCKGFGANNLRNDGAEPSSASHGFADRCFSPNDIGSEGSIAW